MTNRAEHAIEVDNLHKSFGKLEVLKGISMTADEGDIIYLSELYETNSNYEKSMSEQNIPLPTRLEIRQWSNEFKSRLKKQYSKDVQVSVYDINQFFY